MMGISKLEIWRPYIYMVAKVLWYNGICSTTDSVFMESSETFAEKNSLWHVTQKTGGSNKEE